MKKKLLITVFVIAMIFVLSFAVSAKSHSVTYYNLWSEMQETTYTDDNGQITIKDTGYATETNKQLICWYTMDGDIYKLGETVTFTQDIELYEGYGYLGTHKNTGYSAGSNQWDQAFIQLQEDLVLDYTLSPPWGGRLIIDLNGHSIITSAETAFSQQRAGLVIVGEGEIIHTGTGNFFNASTHGYGDGQQRLIIGKHVKVTTNGILFNYTNHTVSLIPLHIFGEVTCSKLANIKELKLILDVKINPKKLTITGENFITVEKFNGGVVNVDIYGGQLELNQAASTTTYWNNDAPTDYNVSIRGGTFNIALNNIMSLISTDCTVNIKEINNVSYSTLVDAKSCEHSYSITKENTSSCVQLSSKIYECSKCYDSYIINYGDYTDHIWKQTSDRQPTLTLVGETLYSCEVCSKSKTVNSFVDVSNEEIKVTVNTENGEIEVTVKVSDVFVMTKDANNRYILSDLKDFGNYLATDIVSINIPLGVAEINFANKNTTLKKLVISDNAVVDIVGFSNCTALTHVEIKAATVTFVKGCTNNVIKSIKSETVGANVTFRRSVFSGKTSLTELILCANSKYLFEGNSFKNTGIKEFIAPDYSDVTFLSGVFNSCTSLEYVYIGKGIERLEGGLFNYCSKLQVAILIDVNEIVAEGAFAHISGGLKPLEVYIHHKSAYIPRYTFQDSEGVIVYTNTRIDNKYPFDRCDPKNYDGIDYPKYTIYYGIGHKFVEVNTDPTCTENGIVGYIANCPCGEVPNGTITASVFYGELTNSTNYQTVNYSAKITPMNGHKEGETVNIEYINGYISNGLKDCICTVCDTVYTEIYPTAKPLYIFFGYSMPEDGRLEICVGYMIDTEMIALYEDYSNETLTYGTVIALADKLNGKAPLDSEVIENTQKVELDRKYCCITLKVSGFSENQKDLSIVMAIYVATDDKTVYLQETEIEVPNSISINKLLQT